LGRSSNQAQVYPTGRFDTDDHGAIQNIVIKVKENAVQVWLVGIPRCDNCSIALPQILDFLPEFSRIFLNNKKYANKKKGGYKFLPNSWQIYLKVFSIGIKCI